MPKSSVRSSITYAWRNPEAKRGFATGVSLHGHTSMSKETLHFLAVLGTEFKVLRPIFANRERRCRERCGLELDYARAYWTPPLCPRMAYDVERRQIESKLNLAGLVSLTDHDDIRAPLELLAGSDGLDRVEVPISVEWTVPYRETAFHIGIHNLPKKAARGWMYAFEEFTALPSAPRLRELLAELHDLPDVLIVFNHPMWDLYKVGAERHVSFVHQFLSENNDFVHAIELNGLRSWKENNQAQAIAERWDQLLIGGGDRHGMQPNATVNLTQATSFDEFVDEIRRKRVSHLHFMPQYAEPWKYRLLQSTLDVFRTYPDFPEGRRRWDDRVFHPDADGTMRPVSQLWPGDGRAPVFVRSVVGGVRLLGKKPVSSGLRAVWTERRAMGWNELEA